MTVVTCIVFECRCDQLNFLLMIAYFKAKINVKTDL